MNSNQLSIQQILQGIIKGKLAFSCKALIEWMNNGKKKTMEEMVKENIKTTSRLSIRLRT